MLGTPVLEIGNRQIPRAHWPGILAKLVNFWFNEILSQTYEAGIDKDILHPALVSAYMCMVGCKHKHTSVHMHVTFIP